MFKDPRTVDQTEGAVQAQWFLTESMNAQKKRIEIGENLLINTRLNKNSISYVATSDRDPGPRCVV